LHGKEAAELGLWERVMRAHWHVCQLTRDDCIEAFRLIEGILQRDPKNAMALADLAFNWHMGGLFGWTKETLDEANERMAHAARRAVAADDQDATAHTALGIYELFSSRHDDAIRRLQRAKGLDPNSSFSRGYLGIAYSFGGEPDLSLSALDEARRLSPRDFLTVVWHTGGAWSHLHAERFADAVNCAQLAIEFNPAFPDAHGVLAAAAAHLGYMADASAGLDGLVRLLPGLTLGDPRLIRPFRRATDRDRFLSGLRKAGLPD
jgi:tetratricopeptide (TPR) repeat protein